MQINSVFQLLQPPAIKFREKYLKMAETQLQAKLSELFENPNVALVVIANTKERSIVFKESAAGLSGPPQTIVDAYVSIVATAAAAFDADSDDGWVVARFRSRAWDVVAYRATEGSAATTSNLVMVSFVRP